MRRCRECYGDSAYLEAYSRYGLEADDLRQRYPNAKIIAVVGFETEDHDLPLRTDIIF